MNPIEIQDRLAALLRASRDLGAPPSQIDDMVVTAQCGEPQLALEMFCEQLHEYAVPISPELLAEIRALAALVNLDPVYPQRLEPQVR